MKDAERNRLLAENKRLRRENEYLRYRLTLLGEKFSESGDAPEVSRFSAVSRLAFSASKRTYGGYLLGRLRGSMAFRLWDRTRFAVRGLFFASKILGFLGLGTRILLLAGVTAILFPVMLFLSLLLGGIGYFVYRRWNAEIAAFCAASHETIYVVFAPERWERHAYFCDMLAELQTRGMVFLVLSSVSACGYRGAKPLSDRLCAIHLSYYFSMKKHLNGRVVQIF